MPLWGGYIPRFYPTPAQMSMELTIGFNSSSANFTLIGAMCRPCGMINGEMISPTSAVDSRPISITLVLSRILEKRIVRKYIYPALYIPLRCFSPDLPPLLDFSDQYGFRPTGSSTAALITLLYTISHMLSSNAYVRVISLDYSKASDTVKHAPLFDKLLMLNMPDESLQLDTGLLSRTLPLYEVRQSCLSIPWYTCISVSRLGTRPCVIRHHCCGPEDPPPWKQIAEICWRHILNRPSSCVTHSGRRAQPHCWMVPGKQPEAKSVKVPGDNICHSWGSPNADRTTWPDPESIKVLGSWSHHQRPTDY